MSETITRISIGLPQCVINEAVDWGIVISGSYCCTDLAYRFRSSPSAEVFRPGRIAQRHQLSFREFDVQRMCPPSTSQQSVYTVFRGVDVSPRCCVLTASPNIVAPALNGCSSCGGTSTLKYHMQCSVFRHFFLPLQVSPSPSFPLFLYL